MWPSHSLTSFVTLTLLTLSSTAHAHSRSVARHKRLGHLNKRAGSWSYVGCYNDPDSARVLPGYKFESNSLSVETCQSTCQQRGFSYAGVEYGQECWCATSLTAGSTQAGEDKCSMTCASGSGKCGGSYAIGVYSFTSQDPTSPTTPTPTDGTDVWDYVACYNDPENARVLPSYHFDSDTMSIQSCQSACKSRGFTMAGVEYGRECWCASSLISGATKANEDQCNVSCASGGGKCGGSYAIGVYSLRGSTDPEPPAPTDPPTSWVYDACYNDPENARVLPSHHFDSDTLSIKSCQSSCQNLGFTIAGVEYGRECWCASSIAAGSTKASEDKCNVPCASGGGLCGGSYAIGVYKLGTGTTPTDPEPTPGSWGYVACYNDPAESRLLSGYSYSSPSDMTVQACTNTCEARGFTYAALEYGQECWCGSSLAASATKASEADCSMPCAGNASQKCGNGYKASLYAYAGTPPTGPEPEPEPVTGKRSVGYFINSGIYDRLFPPSLIQASHLTHIIYAFAKVADDGEVVFSDPWADTNKLYDGDVWQDPQTSLYGNLKQIYLLKKQNRHLKVLLSIGGWNFSPAIGAVVVDPAKRAKFVASSVKALEDTGMDGIDVDYEYPGNDEQAVGFANLLKELRTALDAHAASKNANYKFIISIAAPCGPYQYPILRIEDMDSSLDFWHMMAYDLAGPWDSVAGHQANVYGGSLSISKAVQHYLDHGVARDKLVIGIPLYGRSFSNTDGPGTPFNGVGPGSWEEGIYDYRELPLPGAQTFRDESMMASWTYNPTTREMISYDDPTIARLKGEWIKSQGFGGSMYWELSADKGTGRSVPGHTESPGESLIQTITTAMGTLDSSPNWLQYEGSKYPNIRNNLQ